MNSNQKDNINSNSHESMNDSYDQINEHPNSENKKQFDDDEKKFFRKLLKFYEQDVSRQPEVAPPNQHLSSLFQGQSSNRKISEEVWIEHRSRSLGKIYHYNPRTFKSSWSIPSGPNITVISLEQVEYYRNQNTNDDVEPNEFEQQLNDAEMKNDKDETQGNEVATYLMHHSNIGNLPDLISEKEINKRIGSSIIRKAKAWRICCSSSGRRYYYNSYYDRSVWKKPSALRNLEVARAVTISQLRYELELKVKQNLDSKSDVGLPMNISNTDVTSFKERDEELQEANENAKIDENPEALEKLQFPDKTRSVFCTPVEGTSWNVIWTEEGRVFYFNSSTKSSKWEKPHDLKERSDVDKMVLSPPPEVVQALESADKQSLSKKTKFDADENSQKIETTTNNVESKENDMKDSAIVAVLKVSRE